MFQPAHPLFSSAATLLSRVFPQSPAQSAIAELVTPEDYLQSDAQQSTSQIELNRQELTRLNTYKLPKRRAQWLTGRLCAKRAVSAYCRRYLPHLSVPAENLMHIDNTSTGRPLLTGQIPAELRHLDISISHSGQYAAAVVASTLCGIDLQERSATLARVSDRFCLDEEEEILAKQRGGLDRLWHLTLLWTAKEAAKKSLSSQNMPGFLDLVLQNIDVLADAGLVLHFRRKRSTSPTPDKALRVAAMPCANYALAFCLTEEPPHA